jgi:TonB family protein
MGSAVPIPPPDERPIGSANRQWKAGWSRWVVRSTGIAVVAHAVLFIAWPAWKVNYRERPVIPELVQIKPILTAGAFDELDEFPAAAPPTEQETEGNPSGGGAEMEIELADLMLARGDVEPGVVYPILPAMGQGRPGPPAPPLILDQVRGLEVETAIPTSLVWPLIRNPRGVSRFLHRRAIPAGHGSDSETVVSVAMRINDRGGVEWAEVSRSSGSAELDAIALAAFNEVAAFRPARNLGAPVAVGVEISVLFQWP